MDRRASRGAPRGPSTGLSSAVDARRGLCPSASGRRRRRLGAALSRGRSPLRRRPPEKAGRRHGAHALRRARGDRRGSCWPRRSQRYRATGGYRAADRHGPGVTRTRVMDDHTLLFVVLLPGVVAMTPSNHRPKVLAPGSVRLAPPRRAGPRRTREERPMPTPGCVLRQFRGHPGHTRPPVGARTLGSRCDGGAIPKVIAPWTWRYPASVTI